MEHRALFLNIIDPEYPKFYHDTFHRFLDFMADHESNDILIHCNQGLSRAPALAMLYLFRNKPFTVALDEYRKLDPAIRMNGGIELYLREFWDEQFRL